MDASGEVADLMVKESIQLTEESIKLLAAGCKNLTAFLYALAKDNKKLVGKTSMKRLLREGKELKTFCIKAEDLNDFRKYAKPNILFAAIRDTKEDDGVVALVTNTDFVSPVNLFMQRRGYPAPTQTQEDDTVKKDAPRTQQGNSSPERGNGSTVSRMSQTTIGCVAENRCGDAGRSGEAAFPAHTAEIKITGGIFCMANLEQIVSRKAENDTKWKEAQQAERENTTAMQDAGITEITSNPEAYARYLEMQGDNPSYSAGNIALVMFGNPEATVFGTRDRWKTLSRSVMDSEKSNGVKIFARSPMGRGYTLADAYDIKQTQGRDISRITLQNDSKEMEAALTTVLNYAVVPVVIDKELPAPAFYDSANLELAINPDYPDNEAFAAITAEVAHSRFHAKGANASYDRGECELDAQSISYILCRRYGIERPMPDMSNLAALYEGWEPQECRQALDNIQDTSKQFGRSIEKNLEMGKQRSRAPVHRPTR